MQKRKDYRPESFDYSLEVAEGLLVGNSSSGVPPLPLLTTCVDKSMFAGVRACGGWQVFTLTLSYSLMAPLITLFGLAYFVLVFIINRYNLIYVNEQRWQGGGTRLPCLFLFFVYYL